MARAKNAIDVPDEAYAAAAAQGRKFPLAWERIVDAAAPHIAWSAQVAVLREKSARAEEESRVAIDRHIRQRWQFLAMWLSGEANTLEAGAGQTEVRDVR